MPPDSFFHRLIFGLVLVAGLGGCTFSQFMPNLGSLANRSEISAPNAPGTATPLSVSPRDRECLMRAMYFESNRSSEDGMLAVGTVVMNRLESEKFPATICTVVGQPNQFAPGVLSRPMRETKPRALAASVANRIIAGARHPGVKTAKFFHQAGLRFPYNNMRYVLEAGGNEFYIKT